MFAIKPVGNRMRVVEGEYEKGRRKSKVFRTYDGEFGFFPDFTFDTKEEADALAEKYNNRVTMLPKSYLKDEYILDDDKFNKLLEIQTCVNKELKDFPGYMPFDFCDVSANGIQLRGKNESLKGYCPLQVTLPYSLENYMDVAKQFVEEYKKYYGDEANIKYMQHFIEMGEKYGWD